MRVLEFVRFDDLAQADDLAARVRNFDAHGRLARNTLDQDRFRLKPEAEVFRKSRDAAVFNTGFGLELEGGDDGSGIDLHDRSQDVEFLKLCFYADSDVIQLLLVILAASLRLI